MFVREVKPRLILNSRKERTIEVELKTYEGIFTASAPSGKSRGKNEVEQYNSDGIDHSFRVLKFFCEKISNRNFVIKKLEHLQRLVTEIKKFEAKYGQFGGNVIYVLETVFLKAAAADNKKKLWELVNDDVNEGRKPKMPMPIGNCIGGGLHSKPIKGRKPDFQEFLLIPKEKTFARAVTKNVQAYNFAKRLIRVKKRNDEGAWETKLNNENSLEALRYLGRRYGIRIGIDVAASTFYNRGYYRYKNKELIRDRVDQSDYIEKLIQKFKLFYIEDPMNEEDFSGFKEILNVTKKIKKDVLIAGDDLTTTNLRRVRRAIESKAINSIVIKPNQIGSILEVKKVVELCKRHKIKMIFSHRSGETRDDAIADYCVGFGGHFLKTGIYGRERLIKLKRMMDIEKQVNK